MTPIRMWIQIPDERIEAADRLLKGVWLLWKIAFGAILGLLIVGCGWLIGAILRT